MRSPNAPLTRSLSNILIWGCSSQRLRSKALHYTRALLSPDLLNLLVNTRNALVSYIPPAHTMLGSYCFFFFFTFPGGSNGKECAFNVRDLGLIPGLGKIPWRREWLPTPGFLPGESHGESSLVGYSPRGCKESDTTEWLTLGTKHLSKQLPLPGTLSTLSLHREALLDSFL